MNGEIVFGEADAARIKQGCGADNMHDEGRRLHLRQEFAHGEIATVSR